MWRIYRGLTPGRAAARFAFPCVLGGVFVFSGISAIDRDGWPVLAAGAAIFWGSAFGLYRGVRNAGKSLEAIAAEESGAIVRAHAVAGAERSAPYREAARAVVDEPPIDLEALPLPKTHVAAGEVLAFRLARVESRRHEIGSLVVVNVILATIAGAAWLGVLSGSFAAILIAFFFSVLAAAMLALLVGKLRAFRTPEPIVEIDREPVTLGEPLAVRVVQPGPAPARDLEIALRCEEITVVTRGRSTTTYREVLSDGVVVRDPVAGIPSGETRELRGSILVPRAPASFFVPGMRIEWTIVVRWMRRGANESEDRYLVRVLPRAPGAPS